MDTHSTTTGKAVATPTDNTWAQAYNAGKLYTVLSLEGTHEAGLAVLGKETIEKLQREFFALDNKSLEEIKKAVEVSLSDIPSSITVSLVLGTVVDHVLYIVIAHAGYVVLKRDDKVSVIAAGEKESISTFSGIYKPHDVFLLITDTFLQTTPLEVIQTSLTEKSPYDAAESLALTIHEHSTGSEAGLVIQIGKSTPQATQTPTEPETETKDEELTEENNDHLELSDTPSKKGFSIPAPSFNLQSLMSHLPKKFSKKQLIILAVIVLLVVLGGGIAFENSKRQNAALDARAQAVVESHKDRFEEALAVMGLNKELATEDLINIKTALEEEQKNFPEGSSARQKIDSFLEEVNNALGGNGSSSNSPISVFLNPEGDMKTLAYISNKGGSLVSAGGTTTGIISNSGNIDESFESGNAKGVSASEDFIYILTSGNVEKIDKGSGETEDIFDVSNAKSMDTFGDNVYILEGKTINKYRPNAYGKEAYFTQEVTLTDPSSIAIDSSIYVVDNGKIRKFTRGAEDSFNYSGPALSTKSLAYTDEDYENLYVVDPDSKMVYVINKSGNKVSEVSLKGMRTITGISASESDKKVYIAGDNKIYSINL